MMFQPNFLMFQIMSTIIPLFVMGMFVFVFVTMILSGIRSVKQNAKNNASPVLSISATVTAKRTEMQRRGGGEMHHTRIRTNYFATFEVESGDRMEFAITGEQSGLLMERDRGTLTFQGTRFLSFTRT